jgi:hypothetical protein
MTATELRENIGGLVVIRPDGATDDGRSELYAQILSVTSSGCIEMLIEQPTAGIGWCDQLWFKEVVRPDEQWIAALTLVEPGRSRSR